MSDIPEGKKICPSCNGSALSPYADDGGSCPHCFNGLVDDVDFLVEFRPGVQIAYVPTHANGDIHHPDVEFGFITSVKPNGDCFCRYWRKGNPGELRTIANSELTPGYLLVRHESYSQKVVDELLKGM